MVLETTTIAAIATPPGEGGIGVIRISGSKAREIASGVFASASDRKIGNVRGYSAIYGRVFDAEGEIDDAVATVFIAPKSYTGEDVVELSCHGGGYLLRRTLHALFDHGAVPAAAGEFTKRAFLNGKMSLTQAEAVMDLISAQGGQAARAALSSRDGALYGKLTAVKERLLETAAHLGAWVDYPDDEIPEITSEQIGEALTFAGGELAALLASFGQGKLLREGVETAIVGRPNVGKSTLMNLLTGYERSIVTDIPGTTRDIVEDTINLDGVLLRLADTAGLRETDDAAESIGVELARKKIKSAELVLAVFDSSDTLIDEDVRLLESLAARPAVAVINKSDLERKIELEPVERNLKHVVFVSARGGQGVEQLSRTISEVLGLYHFDAGAAMLANERQRLCAKKAAEAIAEAKNALEQSFTYDAVNVCLDDAIEALLELTGERVSDTVVSEVFARFCVGK